VPYAGEYGMIAAVEAPDARTVVVRLHAPSAVLLANLAMFPAGIVSPTAVRAHTTEFGLHPVGTGPFRFGQWIRGEKLVVERYDGYWGTKARLDRAIFVPVKEQSARVERLKRGEAHMMDNVDFTHVAELRDHADTRFEHIPGMNFAYLALNVTRKPFDDVRVRRAVAHAIDRRAIIDLLTHGFGTTGPNPMPPTVAGYNADVAEYAHDPARARALLAEAGLPDGFTVDLWAMNNPRPYMPKPVECGEILKSQLAAVGITCNIVSPPWDQYLDKTGNGEHPMCLLGWSSDNGDPDNFLNVLLSARNAVPPDAQNRALWKHAGCQALLDEAAQSSDQERRLALYRQAQVLIHDECPMVPLCYLPVTMAMRREVQGYQMHPMQVLLAPVTLTR
jgi:peptide/nickel transport system substrate-binding protein